MSLSKLWDIGKDREAWRTWGRRVGPDLVTEQQGTSNTSILALNNSAQRPPQKEECPGTSLAVQWLRHHGAWGGPLVMELGSHVLSSSTKKWRGRRGGEASFTLTVSTEAHSTTSTPLPQELAGTLKSI